MPVYNRSSEPEEREYSSCTTREGHTLKLGDLITAYRQGFHVITRITQTFHDGVCLYGDYYEIYYRQVCDKNGVLSKHAKVEHSCSSGYCAPAQDAIDYMRERANDIEEALASYKKDNP